MIQGHCCFPAFWTMMRVMPDEEKWLEADFEKVKITGGLYWERLYCFFRSETDHVDKIFWVEKMIVAAVIHALCNINCVFAVPRP